MIIFYWYSFLVSANLGYSAMCASYPYSLCRRCSGSIELKREENAKLQKPLATLLEVQSMSFREWMLDIKSKS